VAVGDFPPVEPFEHVPAQLPVARPAKAEGARDREVHRADEAAIHVAGSRLESVAACERALERGGTELPESIGAAAASRIPAATGPGCVVRGASEVHIAAAALVIEADGVGGARSARPDPRQAPVVGHQTNRAQRAGAARDLD